MSDPAFLKLNIDLTSAATVEAKIAKLNLIIDGLLNTVLTSVTAGKIFIVEYELDTRQTRTNVTYSDPNKVTDAIFAYEKLLEYYKNKITSSRPRVVRLVDEKNFRR